MNPRQAKQKIGATHYAVMKDGETPQLYYKWKEIKINDGTTINKLMYFSSYGIWVGSDYKNTDKLIEIK